MALGSVGSPKACLLVEQYLVHHRGLLQRIDVHPSRSFHSADLPTGSDPVRQEMPVLHSPVPSRPHANKGEMAMTHKLCGAAIEGHSGPTLLLGGTSTHHEARSHGDH